MSHKRSGLTLSEEMRMLMLPPEPADSHCSQNPQERPTQRRGWQGSDGKGVRRDDTDNASQGRPRLRQAGDGQAQLAARAEKLSAKHTGTKRNGTLDTCRYMRGMSGETDGARGRRIKAEVSGPICGPWGATGDHQTGEAGGQQKPKAVDWVSRRGQDEQAGESVSCGNLRGSGRTPAPGR